MSISTVRLADVADVNPRPEIRLEPDSIVSFVAMADVDAVNGTTAGGVDREFSDVATGYTQFLDGDLLVAKITPCFQNGKIARAALTHRHGVGSTEFHVVRPDPERIDSRFLLRFLRQPWVRVAGERRMTGSGGQRRVPESYLQEIRLPRLSLQEQRRLSDTLDRVDAIQAQRRRAADVLADYRSALFVDVFGDPAVNQRDWPRICVGDLILKGPQNGLYKPSSHYGKGTPIVRIDSFRSGGVLSADQLKRVQLSAAELERYGLRNDDILINRVNSIEHLGKIGLITNLVEPTVFESNMMRFTVDGRRALPRFVATVLQDRYVRAQVRSAAKQAINQASINQKDVRALETFLPPLQLQAEFVAQLEAIDTLQAFHLAHLAELDALFASLQHRAFRGELWADATPA